MLFCKITKIGIYRDAKSNSSMIKMDRNAPGKHKITPENTGLTPVQIDDLSTKSLNSGVTGDTVDISSKIVEKDIVFDR